MAAALDRELEAELRRSGRPARRRSRRRAGRSPRACCRSGCCGRRGPRRSRRRRRGGPGRGSPSRRARRSTRRRASWRSGSRTAGPPWRRRRRACASGSGSLVGSGSCEATRFALFVARRPRPPMTQPRPRGRILPGTGRDDGIAAGVGALASSPARMSASRRRWRRSAPGQARCRGRRRSRRSVEIGTHSSVQRLRRQTAIISTSNSKPVSAVEGRGHEPPAEEPVARLVVGDVPADGPRERRGAERVREPPDRRHPGEVAAADVDRPRARGPRRAERGDEARDLVGVVLAVGVERDDRVPALVEREAEPGRSAGALALVGDLADDPAPAASALAAVSSDEPSSTTSTGRCRLAASTTAPIRGPSS